MVSLLSDPVQSVLTGIARLSSGWRASRLSSCRWSGFSPSAPARTVDFLVNTRADPVDMVFGRQPGTVPVHVFGLTGPGRTSREQ